MKWPPWKKTKPGLLGVEINAEGISFARSLPRESGAEITHCELLLREDGSLPAEHFAARIDALGLAGSRCNLLLSPSDYQLLLVEAPNVPDEELREALRWKIKDMITFPVENALIDAFPLPKDSSKGGRKMIYVVVAEESTVKPALDLLQQAHLQLEYIDITEMALRNLAENNQDDARGLGLLRIIDGQGLLTILRNSQLYLSRQFELPYNGGLLDDLPEEQLLLELQRSLDYYERQLGQAQPACVYICGENITPDKVTETLRGGLAAKVQVLDVDAALNVAADVDESILQACVSVIGASLRQQEAA